MILEAQRMLHVTLTKYNTTSNNIFILSKPGATQFSIGSFVLVYCCKTHTHVSSAKIFCMDFTAENKIFTTCMAGS